MSILNNWNCKSKVNKKDYEYFITRNEKYFTYDTYYKKSCDPLMLYICNLKNKIK